MGIWKSCWTLQEWTVTLNVLQNSAGNHQKIIPTELLSPGMPLGELIQPSGQHCVLLTHWAVQAWSSFWGGSLCLWPSKLFWWLKKEVEGCSHTQIIGDGGVTLNSCPRVWLTGLPRAATTCSPAEICCHCSESSGLPMNFWSSTSVPRADDECGQACCPRALLDDTDIFNLWMLL